MFSLAIIRLIILSSFAYQSHESLEPQLLSIQDAQGRTTGDQYPEVGTVLLDSDSEDVSRSPSSEEVQAAVSTSYPYYPRDIRLIPCLIFAEATRRSCCLSTHSGRAASHSRIPHLPRPQQSACGRKQQLLSVLQGVLPRREWTMVHASSRWQYTNACLISASARTRAAVSPKSTIACHKFRVKSASGQRLSPSYHQRRRYSTSEFDSLFCLHLPASKST